MSCHQMFHPVVKRMAPCKMSIGTSSDTLFGSQSLKRKERFEPAVASHRS